MHQALHDQYTAELVTVAELLPFAQCAENVLLCSCAVVPGPHLVAYKNGMANEENKQAALYDAEEVVALREDIEQLHHQVQEMKVACSCHHSNPSVGLLLVLACSC